LNEIEKLLSRIGSLYQEIQNDRIDPVAFSELENLFLALSDNLGFDPNFRGEIAESFASHSIQKLKELEQKVTHACQIGSVQEQSKEIISHIRDFWRETGFSYIQNIGINSGGVVEVDFGFALDYGSMTTDQKITHQKVVSSTKDRLLLAGYVLDAQQKELIDCDENKDRIKYLIENRFPSAYIVSWESLMLGKGGQKLKRLSVRIKDPLEAIRA
jgi:hypothetical protein